MEEFQQLKESTLNNFVVSTNFQKRAEDCGVKKHGVRGDHATVRLTSRLRAFKFKAHEESRQQIDWTLIGSDNVTNFKYNTILRGKMTPITTCSDFNSKILTVSKEFAIHLTATNMG